MKRTWLNAYGPMGEVAMPPQEYLHTAVGLKRMAEDISALGEDTRVIFLDKKRLDTFDRRNASQT